MLVSLFAAMGLAMNAGIIVYTDGPFKYSLDTETKTAALSKYSGSATKVTIPESVTHDDVTYSVTSLGYGCFSDCSSLTSVDIPSSVTRLGDYCFYDCSSLTSINIPSSVTSLGSCCFQYCSSLSSITIPSSVTSIGKVCFANCTSLTSITVDENNPVYDSRENCNAIINTQSNTMITGFASTVIPSSVTSLGDQCFSGCESLTSITIPSSVTSLGEWCFYGCSSLTSINLPSSVTSLGEGCFHACSSLTSIDIPSSVTSIGEVCFFGCFALTSIVIPSSVTSIGDNCFIFCLSLQTMICEIPTAIKVDFFETPIEQATLYVPEASLDSYKATSPWSSFGTILPISPDGIGEIATDGEASIDAIYDIGGKRGNGTNHGLNIIRMSDGTTRKVLK